MSHSSRIRALQACLRSIITAYDTDDNAYSGKVVITVTSTDGGTVHYETLINTPVTLDTDDFADAFETETGYSLYCVKFTLPSASSGLLYYGYTSPEKYTSKVSSTQKYYKTSSPLLSDVSFVPYKDYSGTATVEYTAYTSSGASYTGELLIDVKNPFADVGASYLWASAAISYLYSSEIVKGTGDGLFNPGGDMSRGTSSSWFTEPLT
jgi:hypothetical protein